LKKFVSANKLGFLTWKELMIFHQWSIGLSLKQEEHAAIEYSLQKNLKNPDDMIFDLLVILEQLP